MSPNRPLVRAVLDCMVFLQGAANSRGPAGACLALADAGVIRLCLSHDVLTELSDVLARPELRHKFRR